MNLLFGHCKVTKVILKLCVLDNFYVVKKRQVADIQYKKKKFWITL